MLLGLTITLLTIIRNKYAIKLILLLFIGVSLQFSFAFLEGRGIDGIKDRIVNTGHAEFARVAVQQKDLLFLLKNYESLLASNELGRFANSKPPGTLFFYMLTKEIAKLPVSGKGNDARVLENLRNTASLLWPMISYFVLIPLFYVSRMLFDDDTAILACSLYLFVPSVNLITLHADQVIYPLLAMACIFLASLSSKKDSLIIGLCTGICIYLSIWFTFALIVISPIVIFSILNFTRKDGKLNYKYFLRIFSSIVVGFFFMDFAFRYLFKYDILLRYENAIHYHSAWKHIEWKHWAGPIVEVVYSGFLNLIEYAVWLGAPLVLLVLISLKSSIVRIFNESKANIESMWPITLIGTLIFIAFAGDTKAEVARLWLFLVPSLCIIAAHYIQKNFKESNPCFLALILFLQFGTVYMIKINQDFA